LNGQLPPPRGRPIKAKIEELRRHADAELERSANDLASEKDKLDQATLEAINAAKH
jgi:ElaB/YqjD/DUF883 family membrane-anchored ribosome-binding protein